MDLMRTMDSCFRTTSLQEREVEAKKKHMLSLLQVEEEKKGVMIDFPLGKIKKYYHVTSYHGCLHFSDQKMTSLRSLKKFSS
ncbi:hypothetical protein Pfo_005336, partial [Paulownia fortunei]